jgi:hypothetical protein
MQRQAALALPDQLLVRYFRDGEIENITKVTKRKERLEVRLTIRRKERVDRWRDLGGGLGYVPDPAGD